MSVAPSHTGLLLLALAVGVADTLMVVLTEVVQPVAAVTVSEMVVAPAAPGANVVGFELVVVKVPAGFEAQALPVIVPLVIVAVMDFVPVWHMVLPPAKEISAWATTT